MSRFRRWLCWRLLNAAMKTHPAVELPPGMRAWQIIAVPRRISETEGRQLADMVRNF